MISAWPEQVHDVTSSEGFSLVDMLVALLLLSLLLGMFGAFVGQFRIIKRQQAELSFQMETDAIAKHLEGVIANALPVQLLKATQQDQVLLQGECSDLQFVTVLRKGVHSFGLREVRFWLAGEDQPGALMQSSSPRRFDAANRASSTKENVLAEQVSSLSFEYLVRRQSGLPSEWDDEWTSKEALPAAVRFKLTLHRDGRDYSAAGLANLRLPARSNH